MVVFFFFSKSGLDRRLLLDQRGWTAVLHGKTALTFMPVTIINVPVAEGFPAKAFNVLCALFCQCIKAMLEQAVLNAAF